MDRGLVFASAYSRPVKFSHMNRVFRNGSGRTIFRRLCFIVLYLLAFRILQVKPATERSDGTGFKNGLVIVFLNIREGF